MSPLLWLGDYSAAFLQCGIVNKNLRAQNTLLVNNYYQAISCLLYFGELLIMGICVLLHRGDCVKGGPESRRLRGIIAAKRPLFLRARFLFQTFLFLMPARRSCKALGIFGEVFFHWWCVSPSDTEELVWEVAAIISNPKNSRPVGFRCAGRCCGSREAQGANRGKGGGGHSPGSLHRQC